MTASNATAPIGRPRDARTDRAILAASLELIAEVGVHDFRMDDVAERARVGKSAIYRRYRSKDELVGATIAALVSDIAVPDTGDTREDVVALMDGAVDVYTDPIRAAVMPSLVGAMQRRPDLARTIREGFLAGRREALREVLARGVARGDLAADLDGPINRELAEGVADLVMRGFAHTTKEKAA